MSRRRTFRIGTWNLAGRWTDAHRARLHDLDCDMWLLTEVSERLDLDGYHLHRSAELMAPKRRWAAVLSRLPLTPHPDPHPASAMVTAGGLTMCSSILPWRSAGSRHPWIGSKHADWTAATVLTLEGAFPQTSLVWGGDWNHALEGPEHAGSKAGRTSLLNFLTERNMSVPTALLPHQIEGLTSIDHISLTSDLQGNGASRFQVTGPNGKALSDHDGYIVTVTPTDP